MEGNRNPGGTGGGDWHSQELPQRLEQQTWLELKLLQRKELRLGPQWGLGQWQKLRLKPEPLWQRGLGHLCQAGQTGVGANTIFGNGLSPLSREVQMGSQIRGRPGVQGKQVRSWGQVGGDSKVLTGWVSR